MKDFIKEVIPYIVIIIVVVLIRTYLITPVIVSGDSMDPTLKSGQLLLLNKINYRLNDIKRFDIVVVKIETKDKKVKEKEIVKRVIGLPGETVEYHSNVLYIDGHETKDKYNSETEDFVFEKIPQGKYLVLGDNRTISADSRVLGLIDEKDILGNVRISLWPIKKVN